MSDAPLAIVLAAGLSTRMRSKTPKVLHPIAGRPLLAYVLETLRSVRARPLVVLAKESEAARDLLDGQARVVIQDPPRGPGDAVPVALPRANGDEGLADIVAGDAPRIWGGCGARWRACAPTRPARSSSRTSSPKPPVTEAASPCIAPTIRRKAWA